MKTTKRTVWLGVMLFSLGVGCGTADSTSTAAAATDSLTVTGSGVSGEQLALPDADGSCAKDHAGPAQPAELDQLKSLLNLTADQVTQIQPILDATRSALASLRAQVKAGTLSAADAKTQDLALHDQEKAQILALLTTDQQAKYSQLRDHHWGPFDLTRLTAALGLSADEVSQITAFQAAAQAKVSDIHAQVEAGTLSSADAHTQIDAILVATQASIKGVLTAEQQAELGKLLAAHPVPGGGPPPAPGKK